MTFFNGLSLVSSQQTLIKAVTFCSFLMMIVVSNRVSGQDLMLKTRVEPVDVEILIPKESRPVRGILVHVFNYQLKQHDRWATLCRELNWAHLNTVISRKESNRPTKIRKAIEEALKQFAKQVSAPELLVVPRTGTGFSAGGMVVNVLESHPEKMLTNAISCSWVRDPAKMGVSAKVPQLFIIGAVPDGFKMLPAIEKFFEPAIEREYPWGLGLQHHCKHDWANSGTLGIAWIQGVAKARYPSQVDSKKEVKLKSVEFEDGWLGDRTTIKSTYPVVADASNYSGNKQQLTWLPDRATAFVWRAWQVKDSPVDLNVKTMDGQKTLPPFNPRKSFGLTVEPGTRLEIGILPKKKLKISGVRYYHGDTLIGEAEAEPWTVNWTSDKVGCFAVWAEYRTVESLAATNPALICFEPRD